MQNFKFLLKNVSLIIVSIVIILISIGALILKLNFLYKDSISPSLIDAIFVSSSSICSLGIIPIDIENFSIWGKIFFLTWIQIGGVGILTILIVISSFFAKVGIEWYIFSCGIFETSILRNIKKITKVIIYTTFFFEVLGAILYKISAYFLNIKLSIFESFFASVNVFCNSGFFLNKVFLIDFYSSQLFFYISTFLTIAGGIGFLFFFELFSSFFKEERFNEKNFFSFSLTTKISLKIYFFSTIIAFLFYYFLIKENFSFLFFSKILFLSFSMKGLGVSPFPNEFNPFIALFNIIYNFIGTAPLGTGAGLKTTVSGLIFTSIKSLIKNEQNVVIEKRIVPWNIIAYSYATFFFIIGFSFFGAFFVKNIFYKLDFFSVFADTISIFLGNGFIFNVPSEWTNYIKIIFIFLMLMGKVLLIILGLPAPKKNDVAIVYPEEDIIIF